MDIELQIESDCSRPGPAAVLPGRWKAPSAEHGVTLTA